MPNTRKAKYVQDIEEAIDAIRRRVEEYQSHFDHEAQTRYWLIDPMLRALGWDLSNAEQVCPEFYYDPETAASEWIMPSLGQEQPSR